MFHPREPSGHVYMYLSLHIVSPNSINQNSLHIINLALAFVLLNAMVPDICAHNPIFHPLLCQRWQWTDQHHEPRHTPCSLLVQPLVVCHWIDQSQGSQRLTWKMFSRMKMWSIQGFQWSCTGGSSSQPCPRSACCCS